MTANFVKGLVTLAWVFFLYRAYVAFGRQKSSLGQHGIIPIWLVWVPSILLLLAGATYYDVYLQFVLSHFGEWFLYVPRVGLGILAFVIGTYASIHYRLLPSERMPKWHGWTIVAGILAFMDFALLRWLGWHRFPAQLSSYDHLADMIFRSYLLIATVRISLPMLRWSRFREPGIILRMRLNFLWWFTFLFATWMTVDILAMGKGIPVLTAPLIIGFWICFVLGLLTPDKFYVHRLARLYHVETFILVRFVEILAYCVKRDTTSEGELSQISWREIFKSPERATYKSFISVLDSSKILNSQPEKTLAGSLGRRISPICNEQFGYVEVLNHLREIGFEYLVNLRALTTIFRHLLLNIRSRLQDRFSRPVELAEEGLIYE